MIEDAPFETVQAQLEPGDKLVIYSDGLTEAENPEGAFFDTERLRVALRENCRPTQSACTRPCSQRSTAFPKAASFVTT